MLRREGRGRGTSLLPWMILLTTVGLTEIRGADWDGGGADGFWTNPLNWDKDAAPVPGAALVFPVGASQPISTNTFPNDTVFSSLRFLTSGYSIFGNPITVTAGIQMPNLDIGGTNKFWSDVTVSAAQTFTIYGQLEIGRLFGAMGADLATSTRGTLVIHSNSPYAGTITVGQTLILLGDLPNSPIIAGSTSTLHCSAATGTLTINGGRLDSALPAPGALNVNGDLTLRNGAQLTLRVAANGSCDRLNVSGLVNLYDYTFLNLSITSPPPPGTSFTIIENDGVEKVSGGFYRLPEEASFSVGSVTFTITYRGGDGNDVVLRRPAPPSHLDSISSTTHGAIRIRGAGLPNLTYGIEATASLNPVLIWEAIGSSQADSNGMYEFLDSDAPRYDSRFYRARSP